LFDTQLRWVEKSGQAPHWTTFVLDAGDPTVNVGSADKTPPKVECRPTVLRLAFVRNFGAQNCQPSTKVDLKN